MEVASSVSHNVQRLRLTPMRGTPCNPVENENNASPKHICWHQQRTTPPRTLCRLACCLLAARVLRSDLSPIVGVSAFSSPETASRLFSPQGTCPPAVLFAPSTVPGVCLPPEHGISRKRCFRLEYHTSFGRRQNRNLSAVSVTSLNLSATGSGGGSGSAGWGGTTDNRCNSTDGSSPSSNVSPLHAYVAGNDIMGGAVSPSLNGVGRLVGDSISAADVNGEDVTKGKLRQQCSHRQKKKKKKTQSSSAVLAAPTAPEVNKWTSLMADVTRVASIYRNGRKKSPVKTLKEELDAIREGIYNLSKQDYSNIEEYWDSLLPAVSYLVTESAVKVKEALLVAYYAHRHQKRKSGEPFVIHPLEVARLLAGLKMDADTVIAGLLHDTVEDTELTFEQVEAMFGQVVRSIVEGETKVSKLPKIAFSDYADEQAENLRQMFVAMTDDYRIIIVKLADRLHNMRTLRYMKPHKQKKISRETLDIFAPLAHRMGIWQFKSELEDTSFMYLYPDEYKRLNRQLRKHQIQFRETLDKSQAILKATLGADAILKEQTEKVEVCGRTKELYSLWHKMETKAETDLDHISDVVALRVILYPKEWKQDGDEPGTDRGVWLCYHVLGLVQHLPGFQPVPTKVKDYISFPKPNGYQSLHTALMLNGQTVEVQIRTAAMHQVAEYGMASHWAYTDEKRGMDELYNTPWLSTIKEWQDDVVCSRDFVECVRRELLGKRVFVFLRNGKILNLARGATVIDAAFQIHTEVGLKMHGAHINGRPAPLSYELRNGDVVSIQTGEGKPTTDWMRYAKSRSTRAKLRAFFRKKQRESLKEAGVILLSDFLRIHKFLLSDLSFLEGVSIPRTVEEFGELLPGNTRYDSLDELLLEIGKRHDRHFLRSVVAKVLKVPLWAIVEAEKPRDHKILQVSRNVVTAAQQSRRANDAAVSISDDEDDNVQVNDNAGRVDGISHNFLLAEENAGASSEVVRSEQQLQMGSDGGFSLSTNAVVSEDAYFESFGEPETAFADHDNLCEDCLPVKGDEIIGTKLVKPLSPNGDGYDGHEMITVHRRGCAHAQRALNRYVAAKNIRGESASHASVEDLTGSSDKPKSSSGASGITRLTPSSDGATRRRFSNRHNGVPDVLTPQRNEMPLKLRWPNLRDDDDVTYLVEIVIIAHDRKLLLADCSEVVSEISFIFRASSSTSIDHATLEFLVKVRSLEHLQHLMDSLRRVPSVMSVERKFGTDLL